MVLKSSESTKLVAQSSTVMLETTATMTAFVIGKEILDRSYLYAATDGAGMSHYRAARLGE